MGGQRVSSGVHALVAVAALLVVHGAAGAQRADDTASVVPDPAAFYAAVRENLARAQASADAFSFKERRIRLHTNPFGRLGTDGIELYQVYPAADPRLTYRRLLERDGMALSEPALLRLLWRRAKGRSRRTSQARCGSMPHTTRSCTSKQGRPMTFPSDSESWRGCMKGLPAR